MCPVLLHIYGPFAINAYGFFVALGLLAALMLAKNDPRRASLITDDQAITLLTGSVIAGILGARVLFFMIEPDRLAHWYDIFTFWEGGLTELGSVIAVAFFGYFYLRSHGIPALPLLDIAGSYAPLMQGCARLGCFFAGCCFGIPTDAPWAVIYTDPRSLAPLHMQLHPTQLYTSFLFFMLFLALRSLQPHLRRSGQTLSAYLMGASTLRFLTDFWRDDKVYYASDNAFLQLLTSYQWTALLLFLVGFLLFLATLRRRP